MILDELLLPDATASIMFTGLGIINFRDNGLCEYNVVKCDDHQLSFDIQEVTLEPGRPPKARLIEHSLATDQEINIEVFAPASHSIGIQRFKSPDDAPNDKDFGYVINMQAPDFHDSKLTWKPGAKKQLAPVITITDGWLYSQRLSDEPLQQNVISPVAKSAQSSLGKSEKRMATRVGCDIACAQGGVIRISNATNNSIFLPQRTNVKYLIIVENLCEQIADNEGVLPDPAADTDFLVYYQLLSDPTGKKIDLRRAIDENLTGPPSFVLDGDPRICAPIETVPPPGD